MEVSRIGLSGVLYVLLPPVIFINLNADGIRASQAAGLGLALLAISAAALIVWWSSGLIGLSKPETGAVICCVLVANTGNLGYPLTIAVLGAGELPTTVLYDVLVTNPCLLLGAFAVGAAFGTRAGDGAGQRIRAFLFRNPPLYGALAAFLAPHGISPQWLIELSRLSVILVLPVGFFAVGSTITVERHDEPRARSPRRPTVGAMLAVMGRMLLAPALLLAMGALVVPIPPAFRLLSTMPTALNVMLVSRAFGLSMRVTAEAILMGTTLVFFLCAALAIR